MHREQGRSSGTERAVLRAQSDEIAVDIATTAMAKAMNESQTAHTRDAAAKAAADALLEQALQANTLDNVTVVVCTLQWD